ncbi:MAG TPA: hypothetical protein PL195_07060 [bacterium]|nr:hypothetical protein [bacterium]
MRIFAFYLLSILFTASCADTEVIYKDSELFSDNDELSECPDDMVEAGRICIDRYEASRKDATAEDQGTATDIAISKKGVLPWMENPMNNAAYEQFKFACVAAGKFLCRDSEWVSICEGPEKLTYSWGNNWDVEICNNVDTFCDDHCLENDIPESECSTFPNCGYEYYCFKPALTGEFQDCVNFAGAHDINGNLWEITDTGSGYKIRGGAFNCAGAIDRLECTYSAGWSELYAGFRCCRER